MVLSGVARTQARFPCGKNLIAQMLCGSGSAKVSKLRLNKLSTFGLLKHLNQSEVLLMIDALMALRCLEQVEPEPFRPVVQLTEFGTEVMKGKASLSGAMPLPRDLLRKLQAKQKAEGGIEKAEGGRRKGENEELPAASVPPSAFPLPPSENRPDDGVILKSLNRWREEIADEAGVPLHYILSNDTLAELAQSRPKTREELLAIRGIGPVKAGRYGVSLLEIVTAADERGQRTGEREQRSGESGEREDERREERRQNKEPAMGIDDLSVPHSAFGVQNSPLTTHPSSLTPDSHPSHYWTRRLLSAGFTVEECAAIRGLSREAVLEHARRAERES